MIAFCVHRSPFGVQRVVFSRRKGEDAGEPLHLKLTLT
jgi:hypothetical protein